MKALRAALLLSACLALPGVSAQVLELHPWAAPYTVYVSNPGPFTDVQNVYGGGVDLRNTHWQLEAPAGNTYGDWVSQDFQVAFSVVADPGYFITHVSADFYGGTYFGIPGLSFWGAVFVWWDSQGNPLVTKTYPDTVPMLNWGSSGSISSGSGVDVTPAAMYQGTIDLDFGVTGPGSSIGLSIFGIIANTAPVPEPASGCTLVGALALGSVTALRLLRQKRRA